MQKWGHIQNKISPPTKKSQVQQEKVREGGQKKIIIDYKKELKQTKTRICANKCLSDDLNMLDHQLRSYEMVNNYINTHKLYGEIY